MSSMTAVKELCRALHVYYETMNRGEGYFDSDGVGKFEKYCEENGYDDESLEENFVSAGDCLLLEFDEEFPLTARQQSLDEEGRNAAIFAILLQCKNHAKNHDAIRGINSAATTAMTQENFDAVTEADIEEGVKPIYSKYCPVIFNHGMGDDGGMLTMLAFQHKHKVDYLANLVDSYNRYRVLVNSSVNALQWGALPDNAHFAKPLNTIKVSVAGQKTSTSYENFATSAVESFNHRCCSKLILDSNPKRIDDSMEHFVQYLDGAIDFIRGLVQQHQTCPFQIDLCVAVANVKSVTNNDGGIGGADDDEDDEADDDDDEKEEKKQNEQGDWIQDIAQKLTKNNLKHSKAVFLDTDKTTTGKARNFGTLFKRFLDKNDIQELDDKNKHYLMNKRLIGMVDRRKRKNTEKGDDEKEAEGDDVYFYEPPNDDYTQRVPTGNNFVNEWFISASRTCLLPNDTYDAEKDADSANKPGGNIGAADHVTGSLVTLSFHVFSADKIKLYLYWNGGMIRFLPEDIKKLLPRLFVQNEGNTAYIADEDGELETLIQAIKKKLIDTQFEQWMAKYPVPQTNPSQQ